jgi:hypothetical protein
MSTRFKPVTDEEKNDRRKARKQSKMKPIDSSIDEIHELKNNPEVELIINDEIDCRFDENGPW